MGVTAADSGASSGADTEVAALTANEGERGTEGSGGGAGVAGTGARWKTRTSGMRAVRRAWTSSGCCSLANVWFVLNRLSLSLYFLASFKTPHERGNKMVFWHGEKE